MRYLSLNFCVLSLPLFLMVTQSIEAAPDNAAKLNSNLEQRVQKIERIISNKVLLDLIQRIGSLEEEVRVLRGEVENQNHVAEVMKKRQRDLYLDGDRRLRDLEQISSGNGAGKLPVGAKLDESSVSSAAVEKNIVTNVSAPVPVQTGNRVQEKAAYTKAFNFLKEGRYANAIEAFGSFLMAYPSGDYADNARYWLGESKYVSRLYPEAIKEFQQMLSDYPDSPKRADAKLKIGYAYYELERWDDAKNVLKNLVNEHQGSSIARLASKRLDRIDTEGH